MEDKLLELESESSVKFSLYEVVKRLIDIAISLTSETRAIAPNNLKNYLFLVNNQKDLAEAIKEAMASGEGYVIDCMLDIDEMVRPMVGGGSHITDFMKL